MAAVRTRSNRARQSKPEAVVNDAAANHKKNGTFAVGNRLSVGRGRPELSIDGREHARRAYEGRFERPKVYFSPAQRNAWETLDALLATDPEKRVRSTSEYHADLYGTKIMSENVEMTLTPEQVRERYEARQRELRELEGGGK